MKSKKILTILLSLAIMFTFMPAMAFANVTSDGTDYSGSAGTHVTNADQIHWGTSYDSVTVDNFNDGNPYTGSYVVRKIDQGAESQYKGEIKAGLNSDKFSSTATFPVFDNVYFYDFTGAELAIDDEMSQADFNELFNTNTGMLVDGKVNLVIPSYDVDTANAGKKLTKVTLNGWTVKAKKPAEYVDKAEKAQTVTITATLESTRAAAGTQAAPYGINQATITKQVKVQGVSAAIDNFKFYKDTVREGNEAGSGTGVNAGKPTLPEGVTSLAGCDTMAKAATLNATFEYDAAAHKVVTNDVTDYTVSWRVLNKATGNYEPATECQSVTEVKDNGTGAYAVISWTTTTTTSSSTSTVTHNAYVNVTMTVHGRSNPNYSATRPSFSFDPNGNYKESYVDASGAVIPNDKYMYSVAEGEAYDPYDFIIVNPGATWTNRTYVVTKEDIAAAKAKETELKAYFKELYEIKKTTKKAYPGYEFWTIAARTDLTASEIKAVNKKYTDLLNSFAAGQTEDPTTLKTSAYFLATEGVANFGPGQSDGGNATMYTIAVQNTKDDDISFEGQTSFTYSGKKTTKKGVLKAKKTITVKAASYSGNAITYVATKTAGGKISVSKAGKITVKKGLKKGTYKVTVKAKTAAGNGYKAASEKQTYVINIKK